jgi:hypothetical protein
MARKSHGKELIENKKLGKNLRLILRKLVAKKYGIRKEFKQTII